MTFKELKDWVNELDDTQLEHECCIRDSDVTAITLALTHGGTPFFVIASQDDGE